MASSLTCAVSLLFKQISCRTCRIFSCRLIVDLICRKLIVVSSLVVSAPATAVVKWPVATSMFGSGWAKTAMLGMWVCRAELPHSTNIVPSSSPATCSFSLSSMRARPPSSVAVYRSMFGTGWILRGVEPPEEVFENVRAARPAVPVVEVVEEEMEAVESVGAARPAVPMEEEMQPVAGDVWAVRPTVPGDVEVQPAAGGDGAARTAVPMNVETQPAAGDVWAVRTTVPEDVEVQPAAAGDGAAR